MLRRPDASYWRCPRCGEAGGTLTPETDHRGRVIGPPSSVWRATGIAASAAAILTFYAVERGDNASTVVNEGPWIASFLLTCILFVYLWLLLRRQRRKRQFMLARAEREELRSKPTIVSLKAQIRSRLMELLTERDSLLERRCEISTACLDSRRDQASRSDLRNALSHVDHHLRTKSELITQLLLLHEELQPLDLTILLEGLSIGPTHSRARLDALSSLRERATKQRLRSETVASEAGRTEAMLDLVGGTAAHRYEDASTDPEPRDIRPLLDRWATFEAALDRTEARLLDEEARGLLNAVGAPRRADHDRKEPSGGAAYRSVPRPPDPTPLAIEAWLLTLSERLDPTPATDRSSIAGRIGTRLSAELLDGLSDSPQTSRQAEIDAEAEQEAADVPGAKRGYPISNRPDVRSN